MTSTPNEVTVEQVDNVNVGGDHPAPVNDTLTVRLVVCGLILVAIAIVLSSTVLAFQDRALPESLLTLGGVAVGALSSMLASTASKRN